MDILDDAWSALPEQELKAVSDRLKSQFAFRAGALPKDWPGIREPQPSITYSISGALEKDDESLRILDDDLCKKAAAAFRKCTQPGQRLYVLDWPHASYCFDPHHSTSSDLDMWAVSGLPDSDYSIFLAEDFSFGMFGHPWEKSVCIFGQPLIEAFAEDPPIALSIIMRRDGEIDEAYARRAIEESHQLPIIETINPLPPLCIFRLSDDTLSRTLTITGRHFSPTDLQLTVQFINELTHEMSTHFTEEVNWVSSTEIRIDLKRIVHLLWPDPKMMLRARLCKGGPAYQPLSHWSPPFLLADNVDACKANVWS
jgi:hypothetical protein